MDVFGVLVEPHPGVVLEHPAVPGGDRRADHLAHRRVRTERRDDHVGRLSGPPAEGPHHLRAVVTRHRAGISEALDDDVEHVDAARADHLDLDLSEPDSQTPTVHHRDNVVVDLDQRRPRRVAEQEPPALRHQAGDGPELLAPAKGEDEIGRGPGHHAGAALPVELLAAAGLCHPRRPAA